MIRHLPTLLTAFLSALGLLLLVLWIWTAYSPSTHFLSFNITHSFSFYSDHEYVGFIHQSTSSTHGPASLPQGPMTRPFTAHFHIETGYPHSHFGFCFGSTKVLLARRFEVADTTTIFATNYFYLTPRWLSLPLLFSLPALLLTRYRRRFRRRAPNHCPTCNYDLRAHAPNSICPECGTPIPSSPRPPNVQ